MLSNYTFTGNYSLQVQAPSLEAAQEEAEEIQRKIGDPFPGLELSEGECIEEDEIPEEPDEKENR